MLQKYIEFLRSTIDKLTSFHFDGDVSSYFEAVGLGFLTILLVIAGLVAAVACIIAPITIFTLPWKLITTGIRKQINEVYEKDIEKATALYRKYCGRKKIYAVVMFVLLIPFIVPFVMMLL